MTLRMLRVALWALVAVAAVGAGLLWSDALPGVGNKAAVQAPEIGGEFSLMGHDGKSRSWSSFRGKPTIVFFGFTNCPDVCPTTLGELSVMLDGMGAEGDRMNVVLISADPERDTPQVLASYMAAFDPRIVALTGPEPEIERAVTAFQAYRQKVPLEGGGYTIDHTAVVYLFRDDGSFAGTLDRHDKPEDQAAKIQRLLET
jgi:protein SCO1/2